MYPPDSVNGEPMSVLVIDNDLDGANSTADLLTIYGYSAQAVYSAEAALAAALVRHPDAVVMDAYLRGSDVCKLADQLRDVCDRCPLMVAVTGVTGAREYCLKAGFDHFFLKPAEPADLDGVLSAHVSSLSLSH